MIYENANINKCLLQECSLKKQNKDKNNSKKHAYQKCVPSIVVL